MIAPEKSISSADADHLLEELEQQFQEAEVEKKEIKSGGAISDLFDQAILTHLESIFAASTFGHYSLPANEFYDVISEYIPRDLVENIYRSIDVNDVGYVEYADFTNFLIAIEAGSSFSARNFMSKLILSFSQDDMSPFIHRDAIDCMVYIKRPVPMLVTGGRDGQLSIWEPEMLSIIKSIDHRVKNSVYMEELDSKMDTMMKAKTRRMLEVPPNARPNKVAITALCPLFYWGLLCVGSADSCVTLYELSNQDVCGRITSLDSIPSAIECFQRPVKTFIEDHSSNNLPGGIEKLQAHIVVGDSAGYLHVLLLHEEFGNSNEVGMKKKNQLLFEESIQNIFKVKIHQEWITKILYISEVNALITSSSDNTLCFVDVERWNVIKTFTGHQSSPLVIRTFSWSAFNKYIVSGADRVLLFWDAFTLDTINRFDQLRSPLVSLEVQDSHSKVFAGLLNKSIVVWHSITFELLQTVTDNTHYKPTNTLASFTFLPDKNLLFSAGNKISVWTLERAADNMDGGEEEDIVSVLYNARFNQVVVVRSLGRTKIYQAETGEIRRAFFVRPVDPTTGQAKAPKKDSTGVYLPLVQQAALDVNLTRLVVLGTDRSISFFNIHDGAQLFSLLPQLYPTSLAHLLANRNKVVTTLDCLSFRPPIKEGAEEETREKKAKMLLLGCEGGALCIYQEKNAFIDPVPQAFFSLPEEEEGGGGLSSQPQPQAQAPQRRREGVSLSKVVKRLPKEGVQIKEEEGEERDEKKVPLPPGGRLESTWGKRKGSVLRAPPGGLVGLKKALEREGRGVLWTQLLPSSSLLLVSYASGRVVCWDLERERKIGDMNLQKVGAVLHGMRRRAKREEDSSLLSLPEVHSIHLEEKGEEGEEKKTERGETAGEGKEVREKKKVLLSLSSREDSLSSSHSPQDVMSRKMSLHMPPQASAHRRARKHSTLKSFGRVVEGGKEGVGAGGEVAGREGEDEGERNVVEKKKTRREEMRRGTGKGRGLIEVGESEGRRETESSLPEDQGSEDEEAVGEMKSPAPSLPVLLPPRRDSAMTTLSKHLSYLPPAPIPSPALSEPLSSNPPEGAGTEEEGAGAHAPLHSPPRRTVHTMRRWTVRLEGGPSIQPTLSSTHPPAREGEGAEHLSKPSKEREEGIRGPGESGRAGEPSPFPAPPKITVDCVTLLPQLRVLVGACSDRTLRFWETDTPSLSPLCSCSYLPIEEEILAQITRPGFDVGAMFPHEVVKLMKVSDSEDVLVGGYESGVIRIWSVQAYSLFTLKNLLKKHIYQESVEGVKGKDFGEGMLLAVSPLTLIGDWQAHPGPLLSLDYVWFDYEKASPEGESSSSHYLYSTPQSKQIKAVNPLGRELRERQGDVGGAVLEGFVVSAGIDQKVLLWTLGGKCVGEFGTYGWDINRSDTWGNKKSTRPAFIPQKKSFRSKNIKASNFTASFSHSYAPSAGHDKITAQSITKESIEMNPSPSTTFLLNFIRQKKSPTPKEMNRYVDELTKKIVHRPPSFMEVDTQMQRILKRHPIENVQLPKREKENKSHES